MQLLEVSEARWDELHGLAVEAMSRAYAPYSGFSVGAAALTDDGRLISGCNVENAAYGVTLCAECSMISELFATGGGTLRAFVCVNADAEPLAPCGRCRQLLYEHKGPELLIRTASGVIGIDDLLPGAFGAESLT